MLRRAVLLVVLAVAALVVFAPAPSAGAHPPVPLCGGCTDAFEHAAAEQGQNATVEHSHLELGVDGNATMTGVARITVDERTATRFRANESLMDAVARDAFRTPEPTPENRWADQAVLSDVERVDATIDDRTVVVRFVVPDAAGGGVGGVVFTDALQRTASEGAIELRVDSATVSGPTGATLVRAPGDADGDAIVWPNTGETTRVGYGGYVAWAPAGGVVGALAAAASIWFAEGLIVYPVLTIAGWPSVALAGVLASGFVATSRRLEPEDGEFERRIVDRAGVLALAYLLAAVLLLGAAWVALEAGIGWLGLSLLVATTSALVAIAGLLTVGWLDRTSKQERAVVPTAALSLPLAASAVALVLAVSMPGVVFAFALVGALPVAGALGVAAARSQAVTVRVAPAFALLPLGVVAVATRSSVFEAVSPLAWTAFVGVLGAPLFAFWFRRERAGTATEDDQT